MAYLKKINVTYRFKLRVLSLDEYQGFDQEQKEKLWSAYLYSLSKVRLISRHQANTWTYPKVLIKSK